MAKKIVDFGERIGGARKDLWREDFDLADYTEEELMEYIKRDVLWPLPDAKKQVTGGMDPFIAFWQRSIRRKIMPVPRVFDGDDLMEVRTAYTRMALKVRKAAMAVTDMDGVVNFYEIARDEFGDHYGYRHTFAERIVYSKYRIADMQNNVRITGFPFEKRKKPDRKKVAFVPPQLSHVTREGEDFRHGVHIDDHAWQRVFHFRGVQFGNWMSQKDRQYSMDYCFDALKDLAIALQISDKDIAFDGKLAMAFGSRGTSGTCAHYECTRKVINLTKIHGAGCTAHEWGHALDNMLARFYGIHDTLLASTSAEKGKLPAVFCTLCSSLQRDASGNETDYFRGSRQFDRHFKKDAYGYWSSVQEMFARAFACYVKDTLGYTSDYLFAHADTYVFQYENQRACAIPQGEEREIFNELFDQLFYTLKAENFFHEPGWGKEDTEITLAWKGRLKKNVCSPIFQQEPDGQLIFAL
ncbi:hypothetical protein LKD70_09200 [Ruminococcus sp. CLA-AA-H200]|uniref:Large polyvalent protein-associated domain-containing protein n=1 Tax=Ruminococcus turbiniformis TaxID=2881258 RepID=A0ABS8FX28_9FIRM|nr:LPD1 domain-containing protein [Ruminococcus turbiniformis]MCC2254591.1 hypothetical protein [Ruminococcus turbiniformis]